VINGGKNIRRMMQKKMMYEKRVKMAAVFLPINRLKKLINGAPIIDKTHAITM
jgi:hypothetical protein